MPKESMYFKIENLNGKHDVKQIKKQLDKLDGMISVSVNTQNHNISVDFDNTGISQSHIEASLKDLGFNISKYDK